MRASLECSAEPSVARAAASILRHQNSGSAVLRRSAVAPLLRRWRGGRRDWERLEDRTWLVKFSPGSWPQIDRLLAHRKLLRALTAGRGTEGQNCAGGGGGLQPIFTGILLVIGVTTLLYSIVFVIDEFPDDAFQALQSVVV